MQNPATTPNPDPAGSVSFPFGGVVRLMSSRIVAGGDVLSIVMHEVMGTLDCLVLLLWELMVPRLRRARVPGALCVRGEL